MTAKSSPGPIKVIAFDLDDTLWEMRPLLLKAEERLNEFLGRAFPRLRYDVVSMRELRHELLAEKPELAHRITAFRQCLIQKAMIKSAMTEAQAQSGAQQAMSVFLDARHDVRFFDDVIATLRQLSDHYLLGSLTNGNADIRRLGLEDLFSFSFSAEEVGARKPAPDLFHKALAHTGVNAKEMVYVGDDPVQDVAAANQAGLFSVWVNRAGDPPVPESEPHAIISCLGELPEAVEGIEKALTQHRQ
ncbi:MAG: HAD-IA family hydrolase [Gammaproteobacteria bacterium]|nr:HAD-IA family hydrolase [Gammaproteobacteria bacterium]